MAERGLLQRIKGFKTISVIGMDKNSGKTTVLNHILEEGRGEYIFGLTSIGWDGESVDQVTNTEKPSIYVDSGTLMATAKGCLSRSDITLEIVGTTGINTPMGEVILARALSCGYVELAGPSTASGVSDVCGSLLKLGADQVIVDGALSRKSSASPSVTEGVILSTGASLSRDIDRVVEETEYITELFSINVEKDAEIIGKCREMLSYSKAGIIYDDGSYKIIDIPTALEASNEITGYMNENTSYVAVKGIVTDKFLKGLMNSICIKEGVTLIIQDGTRIFAGKETFYMFEKRGFNIRAIDGINLICVTANPTSPYGYEFESRLFLEKLRLNIPFPVYDVCGGE